MQDERFGVRDLAYSAWHRTGSIARYVGMEQAQLLSMVDADAVLWLELDQGSKAPLALVEAAIDVGQDYKPATAIKMLAKRARIPAYLVLYQRGAERNPADARWSDLAGFRVRRLWPRTEMQWRHISPPDWARALLRIRAWSARRYDLVAANDPHWNEQPEHVTTE